MNCFKPSAGFVLASLTLMVVSAQAQESDELLPLLKPKVKTIAAFKNGLGFVFKAGETKLKDGWARMDELPPAALGTLWIGTTSKAGVVTDVISYKQKVTDEVEAITQAELLSANVGKRLVLTYYAGGEVRRVEGTLLSAPLDRKPDETVLSPAVAAASGWRPPTEASRSEIVLLRVATNDTVKILSLNKSSIQSLELADGSELKTKIEKEKARAKIHVGNNPKSAELTVAYLEKGIVWSPSYRVNIEKEKIADITLDAVLANDMEDLENVEVSFVVGYPNFLYADMLSPLTLQQTVGNFIQALMSGDRRSDQVGRFGNVMSQSIAYNTANFDTSSRAGATYSATQPMAGETSEDLYFYKKTPVTLKKGDRARYAVFNASVPYEHLYQWDIPDSMNVDDRGYRQDSGNRKEPENHVWHVLRFENTTKQPWTTAPAFTMNGTMPVAQDVLNYAPPGAKTTLRLTVATDIRAEQSQTEKARKQTNIVGRTFDEVMVAGKLKVTNWKSKETCIIIKKSLVGEVLETEADGKVTKVARKLTAVNPNSEIEWEFHLPGGKDKEINYSYKVLVYR